MTASIFALRRFRRLCRDSLQSVQRELVVCLKIKNELVSARRIREEKIMREEKAASALDAPDIAVEAFSAWLPICREEITKADRVCIYSATKYAETRAWLILEIVAYESTEKLLKTSTKIKRIESERELRAMIDDANNSRRH